MKKAVIFIYLILILGINVSLQAQEPAENPLLFDPGLRIYGADLGVGFRGFHIFPGLDTILWVYVGSGYENIGYFRTPDGRPYDGEEAGYDPEISPYYWRVNARFDMGIAQGITWNKAINRNGLEVFVFYRLRFDLNLQNENTDADQLLFLSSKGDREGLLENSLFGGLSWNNVDTSNPHRLKSGFYAEASAEWGPEFMLNNIYGIADFLRFNFTARGFVPIWDLNPASPANILSMYAGINFSFDYVVGNDIPLNVFNTFGGRKSTPGLGSALRGYEDFRFDAPLKAVLNIELRTNLPAISLPNLIPGVVVYFDTGYYDFMDFDEQGILCSTGVGVFLNILDITSITVYTHFPLGKELVAGGNWVPFTVEFDLHF
jgi:hypothetical protein